MNEPTGLNNYGNTCYVNSLIQTLMGSVHFVNALRKKNDTLSNYFLDMDVKSIIKHFKLSHQPSCLHETWLHFLENDLDWMKYLFEVEYNINEKKEIKTEVIGHRLREYEDEFGRHIEISKFPKILMVISTQEPERVIGYKLVSVVYYSGSHYITGSLRGDDFYLFNDSRVIKSELKITNQSILYLYDIMV